MARTMAGLPAGTRLTDFISLGVVAATFPEATVREVLAETGAASRRERDLPAHVMVYYVVALALYMQVSSREVLRCLLEGVRWLAGPEPTLRAAGTSAISQARTRLGAAPLRRLYERLVQPVATPTTRGAWYRARRIVSLDGTTLDVADTEANALAFGRPGTARGRTAFPQIRFVGLAATGTHVVFGAALGTDRTGETTLAHTVVARLAPDMLCLADRQFLSYDLWRAAAATGAALVWRVRTTQQLPCAERLPDGSYLSHLRWHARRARATDRALVPVRVIEYTVRSTARSGADPDAAATPAPAADGEVVYRLVTTILDPATAPAAELAALYQERWEIETAFDALSTR